MNPKIGFPSTQPREKAEVRNVKRNYPNIFTPCPGDDVGFKADNLSYSLCCRDDTKSKIPIGSGLS